MEFVFAKSENLLEESNNTFDSSFLTAFDAVAEGFWKMQEHPLLWKVSSHLPISFVRLVKPETANMFKMLKVSLIHSLLQRCSSHIWIRAKSLLTALCSQYAENCLQHYEKNGNTTSHPVVFDNLSTLPHQIKVTEALDILIAGADTTASTLTTGLLHILSNPIICDKLARALSEVDPGSDRPASCQLLELEKIDYLVCNFAVRSIG
jgi:hypothetical protein